MPNWCLNTLKIFGNEEELGKLMDFIKSGDEAGLLFDFNKVVPEPKWNWKSFEHDPDVQYCEEKREFEINGKIEILDWYWWRVLFWGTKWNLDKNDLQINRSPNEVLMSFDTAWSPPEPIVEKLAEIFPTLTFKFKYEEPGCAFYGFFGCEHGEVVRYETYDMTKESHPHYFEFEDEDDNKTLTGTID